MSKLVAIDDARTRLRTLVRVAGDHHIVLMNNFRPAAILISAEQ
jgi:PHD/YefM family antitoxin component YafN of YafNO toxin-antitoxin module